jgi:tetratricopeptide (TPR) repeat protein
MRCHNGTYTNAPIIEPVAHSRHKVFGYDTNGVVLNVDLMTYHPDRIQETGGECVNCHMPQTTYMQRHRRHDHGFTIPDPLLTRESGIPNACNRCHADKDTDWSLKYCDEWYGAKMDRPTRGRARVIAAARGGAPDARSGLLGILTTNEIPYWRAVAAGLLEPWAREDSVRDALVAGLADTNALVRAECVRALGSASTELPPAVAERLGGSLDDPVLAVRLAAAWALRTTLDPASAAGAALVHSLAINADQPVGQMQLAAFALARTNPPEALKHFEKAIAWDPNSALIHHDYAIVLSGLNRTQEAVDQLQTAVRIEPRNAGFHYTLALGWNELGRIDKTIEELQAAVRLDPGLARAWYNLGLALDSARRTDEAVQALRRAESADASDPRAAYAEAVILAQLGRTGEARQAALRALVARPDFEPARELLRTLR